MIAMTQPTPGPCECKTDSDTILEYPYIVYCPIHAAAPELLKALQRITGEMQSAASQRGSLGIRTSVKWLERRIAIARAALRKAKGSNVDDQALIKTRMIWWACMLALIFSRYDKNGDAK